MTAFSPAQPSAAADILAEARARLDADLLDGGAPLGFPGRNADLVDAYFKSRFDELGLGGLAPGKAPALVALGGYGRGELCRNSDVDILLLYPKRVPREAEEVAAGFLHPLWDAGLDLGHGVRGVGECLELARTDHKVLASLLDARLVCGPAAPMVQLAADCRRKVLPRRMADFVSWLDEGAAARAGARGEAEALLEPDLKDGPGGLRDYNYVLWLVRLLADVVPEGGFALARFPEAERERLRRRAAFLMAARNMLHRIARRKQDKLVFQYQPGVAARLGFTDREVGLAVERFLGDLHRTMNDIRVAGGAVRSLFEVVTRRPRPGKPAGPNVVDTLAGLAFADEEVLEADPLALLSVFSVMAEAGRPLDLASRRLAERMAKRHAGALSASSAALATLIAVLLAPHGFEAAAAMQETGVLGALVPEFGRVQDLVQFDGYHVHPLGRHTLLTVRLLSEARRDPDSPLAHLAGEAERYDLLVLAGLFHDLGKGGPEHAARGAQLAREALPRYGLPPEDVEEVAFLVEKHLFLFETATRRDLSDMVVISRAAETVGSRSRLTALAILTKADAMATGPKAWNGWNGSLIAELHAKVLRLFVSGPLAEPDAARTLNERREAIIARVAPELGEPFVRGCLEHAPPRYILSLTGERAEVHLQLVRRMRTELEEERRRRPHGRGGLGMTVLAHRRLPESRSVELTFAAPDQPQLFATICGVLSLHGLDIRAADIFTWTDGTAVDVFTVSEPSETLHPDEFFSRITGSVHYTLAGKLLLAERLAERRASPLYRAPKGSGRPPEVRIDNADSDFDTTLEVFADDRLGRLYDIALVLGRFGLDLRAARIATKAGQIADVFLLRAPDGQKLEDPEAVAALKAALLAALA